jgi:hypothetical protein
MAGLIARHVPFAPVPSCSVVHLKIALGARKI